ncbi:MAG: hypothetical protein JXL80_04250 [Planctomycetes bacterium]|nr:hypothetical protein [Planctomycetota bacterium]
MAFLETAEMKRRLDRCAAWHRHELTDGPLVRMTAVEPGVAAQLRERHRPPADDPERLRQWWADPRQVIPRVEQSWEITTCYGDAIPFHFVNLGPGALAAFMGCRTVPQETTLWQEHLIDDWATAPDLRLHEDNFYWLAAQALTRESLAASRGRWITSLTDIGGAMDITSYFRGPEPLCTDVVEYRDEVLRSEEAVLKAWFQVYDRLAAQIIAASGGTCGWMGLWYPGRMYPLQCDFSCMIGPAMFRDFALPILHRQAAGLDVAIYHLDGPGAIRHLEAICEVPHIRSIQWVPGAGATHAVADWLDLYRRILDLDRNLWMVCRDDELDLVFDKLDVDRLVLVMSATDPRAAERTMSRIDRLRRGRKRVQ